MRAVVLVSSFLKKLSQKKWLVLTIALPIASWTRVSSGMDGSSIMSPFYLYKPVCFGICRERDEF